MRFLFALALVAACYIVALKAACPGDDDDDDDGSGCNTVQEGYSIQYPTTKLEYLDQQQTGSAQSCCSQCKTYARRSQQAGNLVGDCNYWSFEKKTGNNGDCFFFRNRPASMTPVLGSGHAYGSAVSLGPNGNDDDK